MRGGLAHTAHRSTGGVSHNRKAQAVVHQQYGGLGRGASTRGPVPQGIEEPITNRRVVGWNPTRSATFNNQPRFQRQLLTGLNLGLAPKAGIDYPQPFWTFRPKKARVQRGLPQLQNRSRQGRSPQKRRSAVEVPAVREALPGPATEALRR
jgi:hypothetical protein